MSHSRIWMAGLIAAVACATGGQVFARDQRTLASQVQSQVQSQANQPAQAPWYDRFTFGSELRDSTNAWVPRGEVKASVRIDPRSRWGVTFGAQQEARPALTPRTGQPASRTTAGAFFQINPKLRVGGEVVLPDENLGVSQRREDTKRREPGVKVESAFRF